MSSITVIQNQTIYDICLQAYGTVDALAEVLSLNPDLKNAPYAKVAVGIDPISDTSFYLQLAVLPGSEVLIDTDSHLINANVVKELTEPITTFNL
jgi:hypothetical protein